MLYLDTNIFIYAAESRSPHYQTSKDLLHQLFSQKLPFTTSAQTFQEVIHLSKKLHHLKRGLKICRTILKLIPQPLPINTAVIKRYLKFTSKYPKLQSRDCLHLAICQIYSIPILVTQDKTLTHTKVTKLKIQTPEQFLKALKLSKQP